MKTDVTKIEGDAFPGDTTVDFYNLRNEAGPDTQFFTSLASLASEQVVLVVPCILVTSNTSATITNSLRKYFCFPIV